MEEEVAAVALSTSQQYGHPAVLAMEDAEKEQKKEAEQDLNAMASVVA